MIQKAKVALITGITGQDGSYLAEFLLEKGYIVHGIKRRSSSINTERIDSLYDKYNHERLFLHYGDLTDSANLMLLVNKIRPDEIYNLAAQSHVAVSFEQPEYTMNVNALGTLRLLEAVRSAGLASTCKIYQASTSELFGLVQEIPQKETTPFYPRSPYAVAKMAAYWTCVNYREAYNMFAVNGILFNHESPRRGETFVTRKITRGLARIMLGKEKVLTLGNLEALRDWGHAKDYVRMMWLMLQQEQPQDYVIATGKQYSVRYVCELCCKLLGITIAWQDQGVEEHAVITAISENSEYKRNVSIGQVLINVSPQYYRPTEVETLLGDPSKAKRELGWIPEISADELIAEMLYSDYRNEYIKLYGAIAFAELNK